MLQKFLLGYIELYWKKLLSILSVSKLLDQYYKAAICLIELANLRNYLFDLKKCSLFDQPIYKANIFCLYDMPSILSFEVIFKLITVLPERANSFTRLGIESRYYHHIYNRQRRCCTAPRQHKLCNSLPYTLSYYQCEEIPTWGNFIPPRGNRTHNCRVYRLTPYCSETTMR